MGYEVALENAWKKLEEAPKGGSFSIKFLADEYTVNLDLKQILSLSCNIPPHEHISILILHYLVKKLSGLPKVTGNWISFSDLAGGKGYFDAFKKRALEPIRRKYGRAPKALSNCLERLPGEKTQYGDCAVIIHAFENVPVLITVTGEDEEFPAEANLLFDSSIEKILCTEDVVVLADIVSRLI